MYSRSGNQCIFPSNEQKKENLNALRSRRSPYDMKYEKHVPLEWNKILNKSQWIYNNCKR